MPDPRRASAAFALSGILGAIALSCTGVAGRWCDHTFHGVFGRVLGGSAAAYGLVHFVCEKSVHVTLFAGLAVALWHCFKRVRYRMTCTLLSGFALGCSSELFQRLFPTRDPAIRDVLINCSAVVIGLAANHLAANHLAVNQAVHAVLRAVNARHTEHEATEDVLAKDLLALQSVLGGAQSPAALQEAALQEGKQVIVEPAQSGPGG